MSVNKRNLLAFKILLLFVVMALAIYVIVVRPYKAVSTTVAPSPTPFADSGKSCTNGDMCSSGWCVSQKCSAYELSPYTVGDYQAQNITINSKDYPISGMATNKVVYVYLPPVDESDEGMKLLREKLCTPYEKQMTKGLLPVQCIVNGDIKTTLPVIEIPTKVGVGCEGTKPCPTPTPIPKAVDVTLPAILKDRVVAYAGTDVIFIAPKGMNAEAKLGANGNHVLSFKDETGITKISFYEVEACDSCAYDVIAPYFEEAKNVWHVPFEEPTIPKDLQTKRISPTIVTYSYQSNKYNLPVWGAVYSRVATGSMKPTFDIYVMLPDNERAFAQALLNFAIKHNFPSN